MYTSYDSNVFPSYEAELKDWEEYCMRRMVSYNHSIKLYTDSCKKFNRPMPDPNVIQGELNSLVQTLQNMKPKKSKYESKN
jgi:hypothetical protein